MEIKASQATYSETSDCLYYERSRRDVTYPFAHVKILSWKKYLRVRVKQESGWEEYTPPPLVLISHNRANINGKDISQFLTPVPLKIQRLAAKYQYHQIPALRLLSHAGAIEFATHSPVIFWLLAEQACDTESPEGNGLVELLWAKKRTILQALGFDDSKSAIKMLSKVKVACYDKSMFVAFMKILTVPRILLHLRHYQRITEHELAAVDICPSLLCRTFFINYLSRTNISKSTISSLWVTYKDTIRLARTLGKRGFSRAILSFKTVEQLEALHDRFSAELTQHNVAKTIAKLEKKFGTNLPKPVFPATEDIVPISTTQELVMESCQMQHCVATYAEKIFRKHCSIYKLLSPERATIEIDTSGPEPRIAQVQLYQNGTPRRQTFEKVEDWFTANQP